MELQQHLREFEAAGVRVFAVCPEPARRIARFTEEYGITFPVFADERSEVIRRYGILNTLIDPDEPNYGLPFPGTYVTDGRGRVVRKYFNRHYRSRETAAVLLRGELAADVDLGGYPAERDQATVSAVLGAPDVKPYQVVDVYVRIALEPGLHVYGAPVPDGYVPTEVRVRGPEALEIGAPRFPPTRPFRIEGLDERFHVFEGSVEIAVPLHYPVYDAAPGTRLPIDIEVCYQACNDRECFPPTTERLHLDLPVGALNRPPRRQ